MHFKHWLIFHSQLLRFNEEFDCDYSRLIFFENRDYKNKSLTSPEHIIASNKASCCLFPCKTSWYSILSSLHNYKSNNFGEVRNIKIENMTFICFLCLKLCLLWQTTLAKLKVLKASIDGKKD